MSKTHDRVVVVALCGALLSALGCSSTVTTAGFLSDYSKLEPDGSDLRYVDRAEVRNFNQFIVEPVKLHYHSKAKRADPSTARRLANTLHNEVTSQLLGGGYRVVSQSGPGIARIRLAITDLRKDTAALNVLPQTRLTGLGLGGASMEGEILDSKTGRQVAAVVQTGEGARISLEGLKLEDWNSAEEVIKGWAKQLRKVLDDLSK